MNTRLAAILAALRKRFPDPSHVAEVEAYLSSEGYDRQQIGAILSHFAAQNREIAAANAVNAANAATASDVAPPGTFRVMGPHEWGRFAPEAWGHLLELSDSGALIGAELEQLIERALAQLDGRISLEDLRALMDGAGLDESGSGLDQVNVH